MEVTGHCCYHCVTDSLAWVLLLHRCTQSLQLSLIGPGSLDHWGQVHLWAGHFSHPLSFKSHSSPVHLPFFFPLDWQTRKLRYLPKMWQPVNARTKDSSPLALASYHLPWVAPTITVALAPRPPSGRAVPPQHSHIQGPYAFSETSAHFSPAGQANFKGKTMSLTHNPIKPILVLLVNDETKMKNQGIMRFHYTPTKQNS
jgi:hypothetical protein